jgi:hypothetical protein
MHDGAHSFDTYVVDVDDLDEQPSIAVGRVSTAELTMQVAVMGVWHRRTPDLSSTACGILYHSQYAPTRREELCTPLCRECFTQFELTIANARAEKENG